jgi:hypothetical protein
MAKRRACNDPEATGHTLKARTMRPFILSGVAYILAGFATAQQPHEIVVKIGTIVTVVGNTQGDSAHTQRADRRSWAEPVPGAGAQVIDAKGRLVPPGGIE